MNIGLALSDAAIDTPPLTTIPYATLTPLRIALNAELTCREQMFEHIGAMLQPRRGPSAAEIAAHLMARELRSSTALGHGVALPHAHVPWLRRPVAAFVRAKTPIPFDAPDAKPVSDVLALVVPKPGGTAHLDLLVRLAALLCQREFRDRLRRCATERDVEQLFEQRLGASAQA